MLAEGGELPRAGLGAAFVGVVGLIATSLAGTLALSARTRELARQRDAAQKLVAAFEKFNDIANTNQEAIEKIISQNKRDGYLETEQHELLGIANVLDKQANLLVSDMAGERELYSRYHESFLRQSAILSLAAIIASVAGLLIIASGAVLALTSGVGVGVITAVNGIIVEAVAKLFDSKAEAAKRDARRMYSQLEDLIAEPLRVRQAFLIASRMEGPEKQRVLSQLAFDAMSSTRPFTELPRIEEATTREEFERNSELQRRYGDILQGLSRERSRRDTDSQA